MSSSRDNGEEARDESQARGGGSGAEHLISNMINDMVESLVRSHYPSISFIFKSPSRPIYIARRNNHARATPILVVIVTADESARAWQAKA